MGTFVLLPTGSDCLFYHPVARNTMDYIKFGNTGLLVSPIYELRRPHQAIPLGFV